MQNIDYDHQQNLHTIEGPCAALPFLFSEGFPESMLDVGCGTGTWLKAAAERGVEDYFGLDGIALPEERLLIPKERFARQDLAVPWSLRRRFSTVLCLEVAEHLPENSATTLVRSLVEHGDIILFSAACPGQPGQHHINCQWPAYWQSLFNGHGYVCSDEIRWRIWDVPSIEPWYRQNLFSARRQPVEAGKEPRLAPVIHPEILREMNREATEAAQSITLRRVEAGVMSLGWYLRIPIQGVCRKFRRRLAWD